jgi:hypothetical protein
VALEVLEVAVEARWTAIGSVAVYREERGLGFGDGVVAEALVS